MIRWIFRCVTIISRKSFELYLFLGIVYHLSDDWAKASFDVLTGIYLPIQPTISQMFIQNSRWFSFYIFVFNLLNHSRVSTARSSIMRIGGMCLLSLSLRYSPKLFRMHGMSGNVCDHCHAEPNKPVNSDKVISTGISCSGISIFWKYWCACWPKCTLICGRPTTKKKLDTKTFRNMHIDLKLMISLVFSFVFWTMESF